MPSRGSRVRRFDDDLGIFGLPGDVSAWDVRFDADDPADLEATGDGQFRLRVSAEPGLTDGYAVLRDGSDVTAIPLRSQEAGRFVLWSAVVGPFDRPVGLSFAFRIEESRAPVYVVRTGVSASVERLDRWTIDPGRAPLDVPGWAKGAVIYQIFPDRFANGNPANDPAGVVRWGSPPGARTFHGGDLDGVVTHLDHLQRLGVDAIYLNPIFTSPSNHKYDTIDYHQVDPGLGGNEGLRRLVAACHRIGIRVILDASFNHCHPRFFAFADLVDKGRSSRYRDWFVVDDWPVRIRVRNDVVTRRHREWLTTWEAETAVPLEEVSGDGPAIEPSYEAWYGVPTMPRLNLANAEARRYMLDVARYWLAEYDIDGWRMDVARYVDRDFWPEFRAACRSVKPEAYLLAEIMGDVSAWLRGDAFDATMNYTFRSLALRFFATGEISGGELLDHASRLYARHALATTLANHNLIGSHDTPRFRTEAGGDLWRLQLATVFQLTFPGAPGIYYGDEFGLEGDNDPGCRCAVPWDDVVVDAGLSDLIGELTDLRRRHPALRYGEFSPVGATSHAIVFERFEGRRRCLVGLNRGRRAVSLDAAGARRVVWGSGALDGRTLTIGARSAVVVSG